MRTFFFLCFFIAKLCVAALPSPQTFSFQFDEVRFPALLKLVYSEVLVRSYVIDTPALNNQDALTLHVRDKTAPEVEAYMLALLDERGFSIIKRGSVDVISKKPDAAQPLKEVFIYHPRYRSVSYLQDLLSSVFPNGSFTGQRLLADSSPSLAPATSSSPSPSTSAISPSKTPIDNGTNAYSRIDKSQQDTLVFQGDQKMVDKLIDLLAQLDKPGAEVIVKAVVYEVRTEKTEGSAVTLAASILSGKFGIEIDGSATPANAIKLKFNNIDAIYSALAGDKRFKLVSSPTMRVISGASARFVAGSEVPILGAVTYPAQGQAVQTVDYKSSGVILDFKPQVREDVTDLTIFQQISSFIPTTTGVNQSPTLLKRELQTQVSARADEMIILGGLEESQGTDSEQGLSFLPRFLRASSDTQTKTEIMIFLNLQKL